MAIVASNGLTGPDGVQPTAGSLADTGTAPSFLDNDGMLYNEDVQLRGRNSTALRTGPTRSTSSRFSWDLPSGPWTIRFYTYLAHFSAEHDINERRMFLEWGTHGLMIRESAARNIVQRLQAVSLVNQNVPGEESGNAVALNQTVRFEVMYDGAGTMTSRVYPGNSTTGFRQNQWSHDPTGSTLTISGMRWYNYSILQQGSTDANTDGQVTTLQQGLVDLGYTVAGGVDGDYGPGTADAVSQFQTDNGLTSNGVAGAETRTALSLLVDLNNDPNDYPETISVGNMTITDTAEWIGPLDVSETDVQVPVEVGVEVEAEDTSTYVFAEIETDVTVGETTKSVNAESETGVDVSVDSTMFKRTTEESHADVDVSVDIEHTATSFIPDPPPVPMQWRLAVYAPSGNLRGYLSHVIQWEASVPFNDVGSMTFSISSRSPDWDLVSSIPFEIALQLRRGNSSTYIEPPGCRFMMIRRRRSMTDRAQVYTYTLPAYSWILNKIRLTSNLSPSTNTRTFTNTTPGGILTPILNEAASIGMFLSLGRGFTVTAPTGGGSWASTNITMEYRGGTSVLSMLSAFTDEGRVDWRMNARELQIYNRGTTMQRDRTNMKIGAAGNLIEATDDLTYEDYARRVRIRGGSDTNIGLGGATPWGAWEDYLEIPGISSSATAIGNWYLSQRSVSQENFSRRFAVRADTSAPLLDYLPGDNVRFQQQSGRTSVQEINRQLQQITLTYGSNRVLEATATLGVRFLDPSAVAQYRIDSLTNTAKIFGARSN